LFDRPYASQDTDLYSTVGYWAMHSDQYGAVPEALFEDAAERKSNLYIFLPSVIPFEADPLRYGGDHREGDDNFWLDICHEFELEYVTLEETTRAGRVMEATQLIRAHYQAE